MNTNSWYFFLINLLIVPSVLLSMHKDPEESLSRLPSFETSSKSSSMSDGGKRRRRSSSIGSVGEETPDLQKSLSKNDFLTVEKDMVKSEIEVSKKAFDVARDEYAMRLKQYAQTESVMRARPEQLLAVIENREQELRIDQERLEKTIQQKNALEKESPQSLHISMFIRAIQALEKGIAMKRMFIEKDKKTYQEFAQKQELLRQARERVDSADKEFTQAKKKLDALELFQ